MIHSSTMFALYFEIRGGFFILTVVGGCDTLLVYFLCNWCIFAWTFLAAFMNIELWFKVPRFYKTFNIFSIVICCSIVYTLTLSYTSVGISRKYNDLIYFNVNYIDTIFLLIIAISTFRKLSSGVFERKLVHALLIVIIRVTSTLISIMAIGCLINNESIEAHVDIQNDFTYPLLPVTFVLSFYLSSDGQKEPERHTSLGSVLPKLDN
ncbi:unnamed protein product [Caenorhabditis angaria]|uniref:Uncharacterized protein n=1 Tax=Caenorhabditis angaria TaxID=860376 RepID=A0A9P1N0F7_9PELO|nr:unnamed protein product [Caenorhabditis angaria]